MNHMAPERIPYTCPQCAEERPHHARGMCKRCYNEWQRSRPPADEAQHPSSPDVWEAGWIRIRGVLRPTINIREWNQS